MHTLLRILRVRKNVLIALCLLLFVGLLAYVGVRTHLSASRTYSNTWAYSEKKQFWQERIRAVGGKIAYEEFAKITTGFLFLRSHIEAHIFGDALYEEKGVSGIAICDDRFLSGCMHELIGRAVAEKGITVVAELAKVCVANSTSVTFDVLGCEHSIGHGIVGYLGYGKSELTRAVKICSTIENPPSRRGCTAGAFMEYNLRILVGEERTARSVGTEGVFSPCFDFSPQETEVCMFRLPMWWAEEIYMFQYVPETFGKMKITCQQLLDIPSRAMYAQSCTEGVWYILALSIMGNPLRDRRASELCAVVSKKETELQSCISYVKNVFDTEGSFAGSLSNIH